MLETVLSHLKLIFSTSAKKSIRLNPSDLVDKLAMFISGQIEEKRRLGLKLKDVIEKGFDEYKTEIRPRLTNLKEIAPKQCCHYDGETKYSTKFQRWVDTKSVTVISRFIINVLLRSVCEKVYQAGNTTCFTTFLNTSRLVKNIPLRMPVIFQLSVKFSVFANTVKHGLE